MTPTAERWIQEYPLLFRLAPNRPYWDGAEDLKRFLVQEVGLVEGELAEWCASTGKFPRDFIPDMLERDHTRACRLFQGFEDNWYQAMGR